AGCQPGGVVGVQGLQFGAHRVGVRREVVGELGRQGGEFGGDGVGELGHQHRVEPEVGVGVAVVVTVALLVLVLALVVTALVVVRVVVVVVGGDGTELQHLRGIEHPAVGLLRRGVDGGLETFAQHDQVGVGHRRAGGDGDLGVVGVLPGLGEGDDLGVVAGDPFADPGHRVEAGGDGQGGVVPRSARRAAAGGDE